MRELRPVWSIVGRLKGMSMTANVYRIAMLAIGVLQILVAIVLAH